MLSKRLLSVMAITVAAVLLVGGMAFADDISNDIEATSENINLTVGGTGTVGLSLHPRNGDGDSGCNIDGNTELATFSVTSSNPSKATVSPNTVTFTGGCSGKPSLTVLGVAAGTSTITLSQTFNNTGGSFNVAPAAFTVTVTGPSDTTAPSWSCTPAVGTAWHNANRTFSCEASDPSGLKAGSPAIFTLSTNVADDIANNNASTGTQVLCDSLNNCTTAQLTGNKIDREDPTWSCTPSVGTAWHNANRTFNCTAADGSTGSGLPSGSDSFELSTSVAGGTTNENASTDSHRVCDLAGNCVDAQLTGNKIDREAPDWSCTPAAADTAWHADNQSFDCTAGDGAGSGLSTESPASFTLSTDVADGTTDGDASTGTQLLCDTLNNCTTAGPIEDNKIDRQDPNWSCTPAAADTAWHAGNQSFSCTAGDGSGSGLATGSPASFTLTTDVADDTANGNASTGTQSLCDAAGNCTTAGPITGNKIDRQDPNWSCTPAAADTAWHAGNQSFSCTAGDGSGSGLATGSPASFTLTTDVADDTANGNASTGTQSLCDAAGNCTTAGPITGNKIDRQDPTWSCSPSAADLLWHAANQSFDCSADDGSGSGVASPSFTLSTNVADGSDDANASTDSHSVCDTVGNCVTAGSITGNMVDRKDPTASFVGGPHDGGSYYFGSVPGVGTCTSDDGTTGSGAAGCSVTGYRTSVGSHTMTATASDNVGNTGTSYSSYSVLAWRNTGFYSPVDMNNVVNTVKGGSTVPLKFELFAATEITDTSAITGLKVQSLSCSSMTGTADAIEQTATGGTSLRYDATAGQFIQNWKTPAGVGCYKVFATTADGGMVGPALFRTK